MPRARTRGGTNQDSGPPDVRPRGNVTADAPCCDKCTWIPRGGRYYLKAINRACRQHRNLMRS